MSHLHGGGLGEYKPCKWYGAPHKVMYPLPAPSLSSSIFPSLSFSPLASGEMLSALPAAFVQKVIYFSCCSPACYFSACRIGWGGMGWGEGTGGGAEPTAAPFSWITVISHLQARAVWRKSFPYFVKRQIEICTMETLVRIPDST